MLRVEGLNLSIGEFDIYLQEDSHSVCFPSFFPKSLTILSLFIHKSVLLQHTRMLGEVLPDLFLSPRRW